MFSVLRSIGIKKDASTIGHGEAVVDDSSMVMKRYRPAPIEELAQRSNFSKKELQVIYRGFKQECPNGLMKEETMKLVLEQFFPQGEANQYAALVFKAFDRENVGSLTFEEFINCLSVLARGSIIDRAEWIFYLYDVNGDGVITTEDVDHVVAAIYDLMGDRTSQISNVTSKTGGDPSKLTEFFLQKFAAEPNECITKERFVYICSQDPVILRSMDVLNTILCVT